MTRIMAAIGLTLLASTPALAQSYCAQVKQGVATYGYASARSYALTHYGADAVRAADRCLTGEHHDPYTHHPHYTYHHHYTHHERYTRRD